MTIWLQQYPPPVFVITALNYIILWLGTDFKLEILCRNSRTKQKLLVDLPVFKETSVGEIRVDSGIEVLSFQKQWGRYIYIKQIQNTQFVNV